MVLNSITKILLILLSIMICSCNKNESEKNIVNEEERLKNANNDSISKIDNISSKSSQDSIKWNPSYETYINKRNSYTVKYPSVFKKLLDTENGDGCEFISEDEFSLKVYASNDVSTFGMTLTNLYENEIQMHKDVTYKVKKSNWFVVSGYDGERIFYVKKIVDKESSITLLLRYPSNLRDKYYDVVTVISKSFRGGNDE